MSNIRDSETKRTKSARNMGKYDTVTEMKNTLQASLVAYRRLRKGTVA